MKKLQLRSSRPMCNELGVCEGLGGQYHTMTNKTQSVKISYCLINFRWLDVNDYIRPATTGDFIHILHNITLSYNTRRAHGRPLLQISLTTDGLISTTGHSRRRYIQLHNMCDICRVVYMSLWSSGQRELERREVLVLPPRGSVGWRVSLVWAFGESTR